jgi:two-component system OmpR family response regulator
MFMAKPSCSRVNHQVVPEEHRAVAGRRRRAQLARILRAALSDLGHAVDTVDNGAEAVWMATECDYDAIVLDVVIRPPDGFEVCRTLRRRGRWAPILLLTARDGVQDRVNGLDAGADDYLPKPVLGIHAGPA